MTINIKGELVNLDKPLVMGILNITPDSFFSGSRLGSYEEISQRISNMLNDGADIIDIGAMSSRPGAGIISAQEELDRLMPVLEVIKVEFSNNVFSIDTIHASVAKKSVLDYGVAIVNDISGGDYDSKMFETVADCGVPYVAMHMVGTPDSMQQNTQYKNLLDDLIYYFSKKISQANAVGLNDLIVDPGFGFSKTLEQNFEILNKLEQFGILEKPILVGISRKSMIQKTINCNADEALNGTSVVNTIALMKGANILRVHDVKEAKEAVEIYFKLKQTNESK